MLPYCVSGQHTNLCERHIDAFAVTGLRTLGTLPIAVCVPDSRLVSYSMFIPICNCVCVVMGKRVLSESETKQWLSDYKVSATLYYLCTYCWVSTSLVCTTTLYSGYVHSSL